MINVYSKSNSINSRQASLLLFVALIAMRFIMLPGILYEKAGRDCYISVIIASVLTIIFVCLVLYIIKKNEGQSFSFLLNKFFGKFFAKVIMAFLFVYFILRIINVDFELEGFLFEVLYDNLNWNIFAIPVFLIVLYLAYKGVRVCGRCVEIFFGFALFALIITILAAVVNFNFENVLPFSQSGAKAIFKGAGTAFSYGGDFIFLLILMENIKDNNELKKRCIKWTLISTVLLICFMFVFVSVFGELGIFIKDAVTKLSGYSPQLNLLLRIDSFIAICFLPIIIIYSAINLYAAAWCIKEIFKIKQINYIIIFLLSLIVISKFMPFISAEMVSEFLAAEFMYIAFVCEILLPLVLAVLVFITSKKKLNGGKKYEK